MSKGGWTAEKLQADIQKLVTLTLLLYSALVPSSATLIVLMLYFYSTNDITSKCYYTSVIFFLLNGLYYTPVLCDKHEYWHCHVLIDNLLTTPKAGGQCSESLYMFNAILDPGIFFHLKQYPNFIYPNTWNLAFERKNGLTIKKWNSCLNMIQPDKVLLKNYVTISITSYVIRKTPKIIHKLILFFYLNTG